MANKRIKRRVGDVVKIMLEDGSFCFGRILEEPLVAFYDAKTKAGMSIEKVLRLPILFRVYVMNSAITSGRWEVIGSQELDDDLKSPAVFFKQDAITNKLYIYKGAKEIAATREQCNGLERAAVWNPEHVEDRLRDYYLGVENKWVESLKIK